MEPKQTGRRSPDPAERRRDAERTKRKLLEAALTEFADHGYDGARVGDIAARAGVNKQLISYYFGGKEGLYRAMQREWLETEREHTDADVNAADLLRWYLGLNLADTRIARLSLWRALSDEAPDEETEAVLEREQEQMRRRQERGEIAAGLDTAAVQLALMGMALAPVILRHDARRLFGVDIDDPEFATRYGDTLSRIIAGLAEEHHPKGNTEP
ncbi:TetR/AcrR family transcriptional regulator [Glycomyces harbinensis]|uniref:Transcriptional regulator, TetR family n=1 Tax=Glycomyces harbinensis TaxID=58114 RepID=A0A1G7BYT7_9ACTN|nr:TetR family transcriptional regulator [Glycomyces harbinensis]SDE32173.1 transcriptional regulator, TetR family [Glycomyces harbinensis]